MIEKVPILSDCWHVCEHMFLLRFFLLCNVFGVRVEGGKKEMLCSEMLHANHSGFVWKNKPIFDFLIDNLKLYAFDPKNSIFVFDWQ